VRLKREAALRVAEGTTLLPPAPAGHFFMQLALLKRRSGEPTIFEIEDIRPSLYGRLGIATGLVVFESALTDQDTISGPIDPGLGPGPIGVVLGWEDVLPPFNHILVKPFELTPTPGLPQASLGAIVDPTSGRFRIGVRAQGNAAEIRVRWWAFRPSQDRGTLIVPQGISVTVDPQTITLRQGEQRLFTATVTGTPNQTVTWSLQEGTTGGVIDGAGNYIAPNRAGTFHVVATSQADATKSATATVTVLAVGVGISPTTAALLTGRQQQFNATVTGTVNTGVTWRVQEAGGGSITSGGLYTAPNIAGTFHVIATSQADATKSATATVTVSLVSVSVTPSTTSLSTGGQRQFTATVSGTSNTGVTWRVQEAGGGSITAGGLYTAPGVGGTFHVIATSQADATKSGSATVTVTKPKETKETKEEKDTKEKEGEKLAPKELDQPPVRLESEQPTAPRRRRRERQQPSGRAFISQEERPEVGRDILRGHA
jgi:hypothetical protein